MTKPFDAYVEQQKRKAEVLEASIRADERKRIITLLEDLRDSEYAEVLTHDDLIALIKGEN